MTISLRLIEICDFEWYIYRRYIEEQLHCYANIQSTAFIISVRCITQQFFLLSMKYQNYRINIYSSIIICVCLAYNLLLHRRQIVIGLMMPLLLLLLMIVNTVSPWRGCRYSGGRHPGWISCSPGSELLDRDEILVRLVLALLLQHFAVALRLTLLDHHGAAAVDRFY